ncbi:hypothetical protein D3C85_1699620 [compost metagenome]
MRGGGEHFVQVFGDDAGFGQVEVRVRQGRHPPREGSALERLHALFTGPEVDGAHFERQLLFGQRYIHRHGVRTEEQGIDV